MPVRPCAEPGCPTPATYRGRCPEHRRRKARSDYAGTTKPLYWRSRWRYLRRKRLSMEPLCRACLKGGRETLATEADHIVPVNDGGLMWDLSNTQSLCKPCHSRKSRGEQR